MLGRLLYRLDLMRICLGIFLVLDGFPLIFYIKDFLRLAPGSTTFTALFIAGGLVLMIPFSFLRKLYRPNETLFWALLVFVILCIGYMYFYNEVAADEKSKDIIYFSYVLIFLFLLVNIPNTITRELIFVGAVFAFISNLALIHSLVMDPTWVIGQRAAIQYGEGEGRTGNPHPFARNAQIGLVCSLMLANRPGLGTITRVLSLLSAAFNVVVLMLTFSKASILSTMLLAGLLVVIHFNADTMRKLGRRIISPSGIIIMLIPIVAFNWFIYTRPDVWGIIMQYGYNIYDRFYENILGLLGSQTSMGPTGSKAEIDASSINRIYSLNFVTMTFYGHMHKLIMGFGYKYMYLDIPALETLICMGIFSFILFGYLIIKLLIHAFNTVRRGGPEIEMFTAYMYLLVFISYFTAGRPYEMAVLHPLCFFVRFLGIYYPSYIPRPDEVKTQETYTLTE